MGWRKFKEHFGLRQLVHANEQGVHIGSLLNPSIIIIGFDGGFIRRYPLRDRSNFNKIQVSLERAEPTLIRTILQEADVFERSLPVFTFNGTEVLEKRCEKYGWPNITHDGFIMKEGRYFPTREEAIRGAISELEKKFAEEKVRIAQGKKSVFICETNINNLKRQIDGLWSDLKSWRATNE